MSTLSTRIKFTYAQNGGTNPPAEETEHVTSDTIRGGSFYHTISSAKPTPPTGKYFNNRWLVRFNGESYPTLTTNPANWGWISPGGAITGKWTNSESQIEIIFYAEYLWNTYTVSYNANGGSRAPGNQTKTYGTNLTLSSTKPSRTGYTFVNWKASNGTTYNPGGTYSANAGTTMTAQWKANTWTVSYNANGGSGAPGNQTKTYGVNLTLSSTKPTRSGYTFNGWNTKSDGSGTNYASGATYTANAAVTLYAKWTANTYTVSYNANGGSQTTDAAKNYPIGSTKTTRSYNASGDLYNTTTFGLSRTGYHLNDGQEWNRAANGSGTSYDHDVSYSWTTFGSLIASSTAVTLYANWKPNVHTLTYNANGGTCSVTSKSVNVDATYGTLPTATRTGYTLKGWYTAATGGTAVTANTKMEAADTIIYAQWTPIEYNITYDLNGGALPSGFTNPSQYNITSSFTLNNPERKDYKFLGWTTTDSLTPSTTVTITEGTMGNKNYTANWEQIYFAPHLLEEITAVRYAHDVEQQTDDGTRPHISFLWQSGHEVIEENEEQVVSEVIPLGYKVTIINRSSGESRTTPTEGVISLDTSASAVQEELQDSEKIYKEEKTVTDISILDTRVYDVIVTLYIENHDNQQNTTYISKAYFCIDITPHGTGIGFGTAIQDTSIGMFVDMPITLLHGHANLEDSSIYDKNDIVLIINDTSDASDTGGLDDLYTALNNLNWL